MVCFLHQAHSNESVGSIRHKVAQKLKLSPDTVQIVANDKMVSRKETRIYAATTHDTRLEMKGAKMDNVCLLMKCDPIFLHTSVNW